ncbi:scaffold/adaptor protein [Lithospermum erythrorhizon]|uniref:Scaffold/adaptor protein n=1 Tax=Lithospermum erythrorhizon TaxID=34254 RepID=A0AAV3RHV0_LITER
MDPNPNNFPILSFVMSKLPSMSPRAPPDDKFKVEQPPPPKPEEPNFELYEKMPCLNNPKVVSEMRLAVADVSQARSALRCMGERPDHERVDIAKAKVVELNARLEELSSSPAPYPTLDADLKKAEEERRMYKAVVDYDEMLAAYEGLLREAEGRLERIYEAAVAGHDSVDPQEGDEGEEKGGEEKLDQEVERIMLEAGSGKVIENVDLSKKQLRILPEAFFASLDSIVSLNLSNNSLQAVPELIAGLEKLEELNLSSNELESLPGSIGLLINLKILNVSRNKLVELPDSICHCRSLVELNASFNRLAYLPTNIGYELVNLKRLSVQLNKLRSLPTSIGEMKSLQVLDAHFNELHGLPISIGKLLNLEVLNLGSNFSDLSELPHTIGDLINLKELDISNNQIHELPDMFGLLVNLIKLNLDHNPLTMPPKEVVVQGIEPIKRFMAKRRADLLIEESLLNRSTSWLSNLASNVSGYLGSPKSNAEPSYLDQEL